MAIVWLFLHPVFSASHVQHVSHLHSKFALRPQHVDVQGATAEIRREKKKKDERRRKRKKKPMGKNIMSASATQGGHNKPYAIVNTASTE